MDSKPPKQAAEGAPPLGTAPALPSASPPPTPCKGLGGYYGSQVLCIKEMPSRANLGQNGQVWAEPSGLQPHLLLLEAVQPLLSLPEPAQSQWVKSGGWRA